MADDRYDKVKHDGKTVDKYTDYNIHIAEDRLGYPLSIVQGSYNKGVGASAGTHDGGGVIDLKPWDWERKVRVLRELGFAAWYRPARRGVWPAHIHAVLIGNERLSPAAQRQVDAYRRGRDGLAGNGYDSFWRPNPLRVAAYESSTTEAPVYRYPADIFGKNWKLTIPFDGPDAGSGADEIRQPRLATYSSKFCRVNTAGDSAVFTVNHGTPTTSGSKNPRSELREMKPGGLDEITWDGRRGRHRMKVDLSINHLTVVKPHVVVAQIHGAGDDLTVLRGEGVKGTDRIKMWLTKGDDTHAFALGEIRLTQRFKFGFDVSDGKVRFDWNGRRLLFTVPATGGCYFKTGCYLQSNPSTAPGESSRAYAQVRMFTKPEVFHV